MNSETMSLSAGQSKGNKSEINLEGIIKELSFDTFSTSLNVNDEQFMCQG